MPHRRIPLEPVLATALATLAVTNAQSQPVKEQALPEVRVQAQAERADGPVDGYRATRSASYTKTDTSLMDTPASITVVPEQLMKDQSMQSMGDVFRYVPGALMHQGEGNRDQLILRGQNTSADFYVNGVRDDAQIFRDLYNLERVEVVKGPAGMIFGRGSAGGLVNRVTKKPVFARVGNASFTLGSDDQKRITADYGDKLNDSTAFRFNMMGETAGNFVDGVDMDRRAVNPTLTFAFSAQTSVTFDTEHLHDGRVPNRGVPSYRLAPLNADSAQFFGNASQSTSYQNSNSFAATLDHEFSSDLTLRNTLRVTDYQKYYQNVYPGGAVNTSQNMTISAYNNSNQRNNTFNQTDLTIKFKTGSFEHTLLVGMELGNQNSVNLRNTGFFGAATSVTVPVSNPYAVATTFRQNGTDANNKVNGNTAALYVQEQIDLSREWKLLAGVRYDHFEANLYDRRTLVPATNLSSTDVGFSPRAGILYEPTPNQTYYASYSYSFLPSAEQLGLVPANVNLQPETALNYEVGGRWNLRPDLTLSTAVYQTERDNVKSFNPAVPGTFVQTGQLKTRGVEIGLQGDITRYWSVFGGYSYMNSRVEQPFNSNTTPTTASVVPIDNKPALTPENALSVWNKFDLTNGWASGLGLIYQGASYTSYNNTVKLPAFARADGAVYHTLAGGKTRLQINVENLFNKKYWPTDDGDNNISVGAPRNFRAVLLTSF